MYLLHARSVKIIYCFHFCAVGISGEFPGVIKEGPRMYLKFFVISVCNQETLSCPLEFH